MFVSRAFGRPVIAFAAITLFSGAPAAWAEGKQNKKAPPVVFDEKLLAEVLESPHSLLFEAYRDDNWDLWVLDLGNSKSKGAKSKSRNPRRLTDTKEAHELYPQASADGKRIAFVADEEIEDKRVRSVYVMRRDGSERTLVERNARQPTWSPDGRTLAYLRGEFDKFTVTDFASKGIFFYDCETNKTRAHPNNAKIHHLYNPTWTPDGNWIIATVHGGMGFGHAILALPVDGKEVFDLKIGGCRPTISPDGKLLCWGLNDHTIAVGDFTVEGGTPKVSNIRKPIIGRKHTYHSEWSPDGKYLTFSYGPGGRVKAIGPGTSRGLAEFVGVRAEWDLYVVRAEGGPWARLTTNGASNKESEWLPAVK